MYEEVLRELADPGVLRAGINMGNMLLVTGESDNGDPAGVAPDMAAGLAERLGVGVKFVKYPMPGELADARARDEWDIGLIAIEPKRAEVINFCKPYVEIECTYLAPEDSGYTSCDHVDRQGVRIAVANRAAYDLYLTRTLKHADLVRAEGLSGAVELYRNGGADVLAGLAPALSGNIVGLPGNRVLPGRFTAVAQAMGTKHESPNLKAFMEIYTAEMKSTGAVQALIGKHGVTGKLVVAAAD